MTTYPGQQAPQQSQWDIGGDGGNSFQFDQVGASVTGTIESLQEVQQTDLDSGEPRTFANGQPMMMYRITLRTTQRDATNPMDDGRRDVYLKGSRKAETQSSLAAVLQAVKLATGGTNLQPGATLTLTYIGDGQQASRGKNAPKLYSATYVPPALNIGGQHPQQQAPHGYGQPAYAPAPQPGYTPQPQPGYAPQPQPGYTPAPAATYAPQPSYQQPPVQQAVAPTPVTPAAPPAPPVPPAPAAAPQSWPWTPEQLATVRNAGVDPATVWPQDWPAYLAAGGQ